MILEKIIEQRIFFEIQVGNVSVFLLAELFQDIGFADLPRTVQ